MKLIVQKEEMIIYSSLKIHRLHIFIIVNNFICSYLRNLSLKNREILRGSIFACKAIDLLVLDLYTDVLRAQPNRG